MTEMQLLFDPQPFHLDEVAAEASLFKGGQRPAHHRRRPLRLLVAWRPAIRQGIIGLGGEIAWPKPTRPGDTLKFKSEDC